MGNGMDFLHNVAIFGLWEPYLCVCDFLTNERPETVVVAVFASLLALK